MTLSPVRLALLALALTFLFSDRGLASENQLHWDATNSRVSANLTSKDLPGLLQKIAASTGWQVFLEPGTDHKPSAKFTNLPAGAALRLLLGNLNFALVPQTNGPPRLYVFRTFQRNATQLIQPAAPEAAKDTSALIPNELIVRLKPGTDVDALARRLGAKITGRLDELNTYRLEFADEASARAARDALLENPDVVGIDSNFSVNRPPSPQPQLEGIQANWKLLEPEDSNGSCDPIIGLIDTAVSSGSDLDPFLLPSISVAGKSSQAAAELTHGPAMAQAILQSIRTNTPGNKTPIKILPVDVYGPSGETSTFVVAEGIYRAIQSGANIINLSLGGAGDSPFLHGLIASASQQGVVFFAAAGNQPVTTPFYPAAYPEVIAVTASDPSGHLASYANRGSFVSLMAPGTSLADFQGQMYLLNGTSSAAAFATGYAAALADASQVCPDGVIPTIRSQWGVKFSSNP